MTSELVDGGELDDPLRRSLDQKVQGMESRGFELQNGLSQRDALLAVSAVLDTAVEQFGPGVNRARTNMATVKLPMGPDLDSRFGRISKHLGYETDEEFIDIIKMVTRAFVRDNYHKPAWIWLNRDSNIGAPYYSTSSVLRIQAFLDGLHRYSTGQELVKKAFRGIRKQADSQERNEKGVLGQKRRDFAFPDDMWKMVLPLLNPDIDLALRYEDGYTFGKTPIEEVSPFSGPARVRGVKAMSYIDNSLAMLFRQTALDPGEVSEFIWHHRGIPDVFQKTKGKYIYCTDFSNFDQTVTQEELEAIEVVLVEGFPDLAPLIAQMFDVIYNLELTGADLLRPPLCKHRTILYYRTTAARGSPHGIPSGWGITDVIGKIIGAAFGIFVQRKLGENINSLKEAEGYEINMGDDLVILTDRKRDDEIGVIIEDQKFKSVRKEATDKFCGNEFVLDDQGRVIGHVPSYESFFVNSMCPERQAGTGMRPYPEYGLRERFRNISQYKPDDPKKWETIVKFYSRLTQQIPDFEELADEQELQAKQAGDLQALLDKYGLKNKEEIFYKLSMKDLPKEDQELLGILVPAQEIIKQCPQVKNMFNML